MRKRQVGVLLGGTVCVTALAAVLAAMPLLASQETAAPATITVVVPASATITFDGNPTKEAGTERVFFTPPVPAGKTFDYTIVARWTANGQPVEKVRTVNVAGGASVRVDFLREEGEAKMPGSPSAQSGEFGGKVLGASSPIAGSTVTLYAAGEGAPTQVAQAKTGQDGTFKLTVDPKSKAHQGKVYYVVAKGGTPTAAGPGKVSSDAVALLTLLGTSLPNSVTVNELTTVASAFTAARFMSGESISGKALGLQIAAGNVPNLVDPVTGTWGKVIVDPLNSTQTTALANLNTLGSLISASFTVASDDWRARFFKAATPVGGGVPKNTLEALAGIARRPWAEAKTLYALFDEAFPQPEDGSRRKAPFLPYLAYVPTDFALSLCFAGGGMCANGKFCFDADGNLWSGQNWMPGSQSSVAHNIGGGVIKVAPNGTLLSPPITAFTGMGLDGVGWGTGVTKDNAWATSFNGKILVMDFKGTPVGKASDFPMDGKVGQLMGVGVAANGDVWIADGSKNQLLHFPGGRIKDGRLVQVEGLKSPFGIAIDAQNRVWVSNSQSDKVLRFPAGDPSKVESFQSGISARGVGLDSKGNLWVASLMALDFPPPKVHDGVSIMKQFQIVGEHMIKELNTGKTTGVVNMIRPDGTQPAPKGFTGDGKINVPWSVSIDGNDDVWVANFWGKGVVLMAGAEPKGHPEGTKAGDGVHVFQSGSIQLVTDVAIDPAGNVWAANNWNSVEAALSGDPVRRTSTWGGGSGLTVIYGVASPVRTPVMGQVQGN
jgi:uncharacterized protein (TIGR03000 family)